jgi:hypothetical protein
LKLLNLSFIIIIKMEGKVKVNINLTIEYTLEEHETSDGFINELSTAFEDSGPNVKVIQAIITKIE